MGLVHLPEHLLSKRSTKCYVIITLKSMLLTKPVWQNAHNSSWQGLKTPNIPKGTPILLSKHSNTVDTIKIARRCNKVYLVIYACRTRRWPKSSKAIPDARRKGWPFLVHFISSVNASLWLPYNRIISFSSISKTPARNRCVRGHGALFCHSNR